MKLKLVAEIWQGLFQRRKRVLLAWRLGPALNKQPNQNRMLELTITNEQKIKVTLNPVTDTGRPAALDGTPAWSTVSGDSKIEPAADGLSAYLISSDAPGDTIFMVKADADLGEGVEELIDTVTLKVAGARARNLGLVASEPEAK